MADETEEIQVEEYIGNGIQNGKNIALRRYEFLLKDIIDYEDYVWATGFMTDVKLREGLPDTATDNWVSYAVDLAEKFKNATVSEIEDYFKDIRVSSQFKSDFMIAFSKMEKFFTPEMREGFWAWKKPDFMDYNHLSPNFWTQTIEEGESGVLLGGKGSGKTDFSLMLAEKYLLGRFVIQDGKEIELKRKIATNIAIPKEEADTELKQDLVSHINYYSTFSELMIIILDNVINGYTTLNIGDEMTVGGFRKKRAMGKESLNMDEFERLTRKLGTSNIYIWHLDSEIPTELYKTVSFIGRKYGSKRQPSGRRLGTFQFKEGRKTKTYHVKNIPSTIIPFKTKDIAPFRIDIPLDKMIEKVTQQEREGMDEYDLFRQLKQDVIELRKKKQEEDSDE